jgi:hypothetical protein
LHGAWDRNDPVARELLLHKFRKLDMIDYNGGIELHSSLLNVVRPAAD